MQHGRPPKLNQPLDTRPDGTVVTVRDRILEWLRLGFPRDTSILRAGVGQGTFHHWLREAARLAELVQTNPDHYDTITDEQRDLLLFSRQVDEAVAEGESRYFSLLAQIAVGKLPITKTTTKYDRNGNIIETTTTNETTLPSERALMWILERRYPAHYPRGPQQLEVALTGNAKDPLNENERAKALFDAIETSLAKSRALGPANGNGWHDDEDIDLTE